MRKSITHSPGSTDKSVPVLNLKNLTGILSLLLALIFSSNLCAQECSHGAYSSPKGHTVYLYFPTAADNTFPEYGGAYGVSTSPLNPFNVADLDASIGTTADLRNRILEIVAEDYCEFDVQVIQTTTVPSLALPQWNIVGIGSDDADGLFGLAQNVDVGNSIAQDYARVWAHSYKTSCGAAGEALSGTGSTLERWAMSIGETAAHEAGHNYGLSHSTTVRPGEDAFTNHIMPAGPTIPCETRAGVNRHFSDESYEILAHNIGLNVMTLWNWDLVNPNSQDAYSCELTILSTAASLTVNWYYSGNLSPWSTPSITNTGTNVTFEGTSYHKYLLTYSTPKAWSGGSNGIVPGGAEFHVGASFNEGGTTIVYEVKLKDNSGTALSLHPRVPSFDAGSADLLTGDFMMQLFNPFPDLGPLQIQRLQVNLLPRMGSIESMIKGDTLRDIHGLPIQLRYPSKSFDPVRELTLKDKASFRLAKFTDSRFVDITYDSTGCKRGVSKYTGRGDGISKEIEYCPHGIALGMFPSTYMYFVADVVDPNAKYFDRTQNKMVTGPLKTKVFYQVAGFVPDFNKNGIDDLIDIRLNPSLDKNHNGIPDDSEKTGPPPLPCHCLWWIIILIIVIIILVVIIIIFIIRRSKKPNA